MSEAMEQADRATTLRREFDAGFAAPLETTRAATTDFIGIRLGGDPHVIAVGAVAGLYKDVVVTPLPTTMAGLRGIAGFRGVLVPVYDLGALLGYAPSHGPWLAMDATRTLALAFEVFEEHFRVDTASIAVRAQAGHIDRAVRVREATWPVIDIPSIVATIRGRLPAAGARTE